MNNLMDLYQELIIDHAQSPQNFGELLHKSHHARGHNPLCGDIIDVDLHVTDNCISDIAFHGEGCAISKASASLMTEGIKGKTVEFARDLFRDFHSMLTEDAAPSSNLGKLAVLQGVKAFPMRVKCATLCWHTLNAALNNSTQSIATE